MRTGLLLIFCVCGCSTEPGAVRCATDDNCPPAWFCSVAEVCAEPATCADSTAPACTVLAPSGLSAVGDQGQISLAWNTTGGATGYVVRRANRTGGPYADLATQATAGFVDQGLAAATSYFYVVHALGPGGPGADSVEASGLTTPAAPAHLSAAGGAGAITLNWEPAPGVTGYRLSRAGADGVFLKLLDAGPSPTTYVDSGLAAGATWAYQVRALNQSGASPASPTATATTNP